MSIAIFLSVFVIVLLGSAGLITALFFSRQRRILRYNRLGERYQSWEMWDDAVMCFDKAARLDRGNALSHYNLGFALYFGKGLVDPAQREFGEALTCDDHLTGALYGLGHLLFHAKGAVAEAKEYLLRALDGSPGLAEAYNTLALIDIKNQDWQAALKKFRTAVSINDRYDAAVCNLSIACIYQGRNAEAVQCAERYAELQPRSSGAWKNLGNMYGATGQRDKAVEAFKKSLSLDAGDWIVHFWTGCLHLQSNHPRQAVPAFHEALRLHGNFALAHYNLALCYEKIGEEALAGKHIDTALELNPSLGTDLIKEATRGNR